MLMSRGNIRDLLKDNLSTDDEPYCIYVVRTADAVLYVGGSVDPVNRLLEHISPESRFAADWLGDLVWENRPASLLWDTELLTLEDCVLYMQAVYPSENWHAKNIDVDMAERALIMRYHPCLNKANNPHPSRLPTYIKKPEIEPGLTDNLY
jgi:hypothetical protein